MNLGPAELMVIAVVALLVIGPAKLPDMARKLGGGMQQLRQLQNLSQRQIDDLLRDEPPDRAGKHEGKPDGAGRDDDTSS